jgi:hypothetical protein
LRLLGIRLHPALVTGFSSIPCVWQHCVPCCEVACATPTIPYVRWKSQKFRNPQALVSQSGRPPERRRGIRDPPRAPSRFLRGGPAAPVVWSSLRPAKGGGREGEVGRNPRFRRDSLEARLGGGLCRGASYKPLEAGVRHTPKRFNLIGQFWGAPSVLQSISVLGTQPKSGVGRGLVPPI